MRPSSILALLLAVPAGSGLAQELLLGALEAGSSQPPRAASRPAAQRIGLVRALPADATDKGAWTPLSDGRSVWRLSVRSPEAAQLRVHFTGFNVGEGRVRVYAAGSPETAQEFTGQGIFDNGDFWTGSVVSSSVTIEYEAASGLRSESIPFQIAALSHRWLAGARVETESHLQPALSLAPPQAKAAGLGSPVRELASCHLDLACYPEYRQVASGVALIYFMADGYEAACSGALVATRSGVGTPLFLTAGHCINGDEGAQSVEATFFYESESCGGGLRRTETVTGADYIVSASVEYGDYSLIRLRGLPKSAVSFLTATADEPAIGAALTGIHHPMASYKRISFSTRVSDDTIGIGDEVDFSVATGPRFFRVQEHQGRTEPGSSGSPLLNANKQIVGILTYGPSDETIRCSTEPVVGYGRVSTAWPNLEPYINDLRPGKLISPEAGDIFVSKKVTFSWRAGVGAAEYRLLVGKTKGGGEYVDVTLAKSVTSYTAENLPDDGTPVYARLLTRLESKWESLDYAYLGWSGAPVRAARILTPAADSSLPASRVDFRWDTGADISEYMLYVGSTPGGIEFGRTNSGKQTAARVENLPGNGQVVYARLYSRAGNSWIYTDSVYRAPDTQAKTYTLKIANRLAYPVSILVNDQPVMSVLGGRTVEQSVPRTGDAVTVSWRVVKPAHPVTGIAMGENLGASFAAVVPADALAFEITNSVNGVTYFTPVVTNASLENFYLEVNSGTSARAALGAIQPGTANAGLGYYRLQPASNVRGYYGFYGYSGPYVETSNVPGNLEAGSGVVHVNLAVPAQ